MADIHVDTSQLRAFAARCARESVELEKEFLAGLSAAGEIVAARARRNANAFPGKNRTTRIADSVRVRHRGTRVRIQAGGDAAPEAAAIENHGNTGSFRHPFFGDRETWYTQPAHPFLTPAAEESVGEVEQAILVLVDVTAARLVS